MTNGKWFSHEEKCEKGEEPALHQSCFLQSCWRWRLERARARRVATMSSQGKDERKKRPIKHLRFKLPAKKKEIKMVEK